MIDLSEKGLKELEDALEPSDEEIGPERDLWFDGVKLKDQNNEDNDQDDSEEEDLPPSDEEQSEEEEDPMPRRKLRSRR